MAASSESTQTMLDLIVSSNRIMSGFYCVGLPISAALTGCVLLQAIQYCFLEDKQTLRKCLAVASVGLCLTLSVLEIMLMYQTAQSTIGASSYVQHFLHDTATAQGMILNAIALISQAYFASICYQLCGRRKSLLVLTGFLMLLMTIGSAFWTVGVHRLVLHGLKPIKQVFSRLDMTFYWMGLSASMLLNVALSAIMHRSLSSMRSVSDFGETKLAIEVLSRCVFESYFLTALASIAVFVTAIGMFECLGEAALYMAAGNFCAGSILSRIYAISFLYTLSRKVTMLKRRSSHDRLNKRGSLASPTQFAASQQSRSKFVVSECPQRPAVHILVSVEKQTTTSSYLHGSDEVVPSHKLVEANKSKATFEKSATRDDIESQADSK